jgi:hypothetical protein
LFLALRKLDLLEAFPEIFPDKFHYLQLFVRRQRFNIVRAHPATLSCTEDIVTTFCSRGFQSSNESDPSGTS